MRTYSVLIAWDDENPEEGEYGGTVRAATPEQAERLVREEMRQSHIEQFKALDPHGSAYADENGIFGGRVIELAEGAIWKAQELEEALRGLLHAERYFCPAKRQQALEQARRVIAEIEAAA